MLQAESQVVLEDFFIQEVIQQAGTKVQIFNGAFLHPSEYPIKWADMHFHIAVIIKCQFFIFRSILNNTQYLGPVIQHHRRSGEQLIYVYSELLSCQVLEFSLDPIVHAAVLFINSPCTPFIIWVPITYLRLYVTTKQFLEP